MSALLDRMLDNARTFATRILIDKQDPELRPLFHIIDGDGAALIFVPDFSNEKAKVASLASIRAKLIEVKAQAYCSISEAWMIRRANGDGRQWVPSESEDRVEVVVCFASDRAEKRARMWEIVRDDKGKVIALKEDDDVSQNKIGGRMADLLDD